MTAGDVPTVVVHRASLDGELVDIGIDGGVVAAIDQSRGRLDGETVIDAAGGALLPGLHDHHLHLLAMAAARRSIDAGDDLDAALRAAHDRSPAGEWLRVVGYDDAVHGGLDRDRLEALAPGRPVRVQHRSGGAWVLSSTALDLVGVIDRETIGVDGIGVDGIGVDDRGRPTGRLYRLDGWLRSRLPIEPAPDLAPVGARLASLGITGVTDCTPSDQAADYATLAGAAGAGHLPVTIVTTGGVGLAEVVPPPPLRPGPVKVVLADHDLPALADVAGWFDRAHRAGRPVAVHCVTRESLLLALAAWHDVGAVAGDRVEHASVTPVEVIPDLAALGVAVVTQPGFIIARGDRYLRDVEPADRPDLYRCSSFLGGGVEVGGSTDAPFGPDDPWLAMESAIDRRSVGGARVGDDDGLSRAAALGLFLAPLDRPGGPPRSVTVGAPADLCLLDRPLVDALDGPSAHHVLATVAGGRVTYQR